MSTTSQHIKEFLTYQMSNPSTPDTDRFIFLLLVLDPVLFHKAAQWVFPEKNATVTNESARALQRFAAAHTEVLWLPGAVAIDTEKVNYTAAVNALFV